MLAENRARSHALAIECHLYDMGDKASTLMTWLDKRDKDCSWVILDIANVMPMTSAATSDTFAAYYEDLFSSATDRTEADCADFLKDIALQTLMEKVRETLEADLIEEGVTAAKRGLHLRKVAGPKGLPIELYKVIADKVAKLMMAMFQAAQGEGFLLKVQRIATIAVILKKGKPPTDCSSYRHICLLNAEAKGLAKVLPPDCTK
ncbi:hypothetical protein NDU88_005953 [Pleurodeles waltl]|uniref:Uncharacterized protein n=1 Tax=Pleurodeles waltl TaxID=8319 RepID=A0AAV7RNK8_PLEWA|nr:hypothetical protein NDU88_005953 [Pleurodeles waltl]